MDEDLFAIVLGIELPWKVVRVVDFDREVGRMNLRVATPTGTRFDCPACGAASQGVDDPWPRSWGPLEFFQYQVYIQADLLRVHCAHCGKTTLITPSWAKVQMSKLCSFAQPLTYFAHDGNNRKWIL